MEASYVKINLKFKITKLCAFKVSLESKLIKTNLIFKIKVDNDLAMSTTLSSPKKVRFSSVYCLIPSFLLDHIIQLSS